MPVKVKVMVAGRHREVFDHTDEKGIKRRFLVDPIRELCHKGTFGPAERLRVGDPAALREHLLHNHGINVEWANRIPAWGIKKPSIFVYFPDDQTHLCIDGNHRLWRALGQIITGERIKLLGYVVDIGELESRGLVL